MPKSICAERRLTRLDFARLKKLTLAGTFPELVELLDEADVVDSSEVPHDVVTMYAQVEIEDHTTRERQTVVVCYPCDAQPSLGYISVLSPVGINLLGLQVGCVATWRAPSGVVNSTEVVAILFQPEAAGDYLS
jgi:regulator of nucleoside diphosphate kinase